MKKAIYFLIVFLSILLSFILFHSYPTIITSLQFDAQNIFVWKYAAQTGLLPYRDVFYPYGILNYYVNVSPYFTVMYSFVFLALLIGLFLGLYKALDKTYYACFAFVAILYNIIFVTGVISFSRYGVTVVTAFLFASMLHKRDSSFFLFLFGIISGLCLGFITDQGLAVVSVLTSIYILHALLNAGKKKNRSWILNQCKRYLLYALGCLIGFLPFALYFFSLGIFNDFASQILKTSDISLFAKTPYFHALRDMNESGNFIVLYAAIAYISYKLFFKRAEVNGRFYAIFALSVSLFLFEQKSIIRFLGHQIDFVSITLLFLLIYDIFSKQIKKISFLLSVITMLLLISFIIFFITHPIPEFTTGKLNISKPIGIYEYQKVLDKLLPYARKNEKFFSMPGDPIFYAVNKQVPPYFFTNYEGSPRYGQQKIINYLKDNDIRIVIFNSNIQSIQDGVPDYVRTSYLYSYVFKNYSPVIKSNNFVVLKKGNGLFDSKVDDKFTDLKDYFRKIDLGNIPFSEGYNKESLFNNDTFTQVVNGSDTSISSKDKFLLVYFKKSIKNVSNIQINTKDNLETEINFKSCPRNFPCVINLSNIPLFYKDRSISRIAFNKKLIQEVRVVTRKDKSGFW